MPIMHDSARPFSAPIGGVAQRNVELPEIFAYASAAGRGRRIATEDISYYRAGERFAAGEVCGGIATGKLEGSGCMRR